MSEIKRERLKIECDHNGSGMYWCSYCEPSKINLSEMIGVLDSQLAAARSEIEKLDQFLSTGIGGPLILELKQRIARLEEAGDELCMDGNEHFQHSARANWRAARSAK
jgi:hypothetical protein